MERKRRTLAVVTLNKISVSKNFQNPETDGTIPTSP